MPGGGRVTLINSIQLGITFLAGQIWNRWLDHASIFCLRDTSAIGRPPRLSISFRRSLIIGGIGTGMNQPFYGECCTKSTIQPSPGNRYHFYKHPVEILINSNLSSLILYPLFGASVRAAGYYTVLIAVGEFFYHWNIKTRSWLGFIFQRPEPHCVHHQFRHHTNNFADIPFWDILFGTFKNPKTFRGRCGYEIWREDRFEDMLVFRDVHSPGIEKLAPLHFLPTCIGCSKRWACTASRQSTA
jgi:Fatty acid hydroxylase